MSHDEIVGCLDAYAAGTLAASERMAVQAHLAAGCEECFGIVFAAPVGLPRPPASRADGSRGPGPWTVAGSVGLVLTLAIAAGLFVHERQRGRGRVADVLARVHEAVRTETELRERLLVAKTVLRTQRRIADAEQAVLARGADEAESEAASLREELRARRRKVSELEAELVGGRLAGDVVAGEGLELRSLQPVAPFRSVSGHVLWRPVDGEMVVYAFGLPAAPPGQDYEARVIMGTGRLYSSRLRRHPDGRGFAYLALPVGGLPVHAVEVRRTGDARRFLVADARP